MPTTDTASLQRSVRFWKRSTLGMLGLAAIGSTLAFTQPSRQSQPPPRELVGVAGTNAAIYRIYSDGSVDYLIHDLGTVYANGIPDWCPLPINKTLTRDKQGHVQPKQ